MKIIGHSGAGGLAPRNTLAGLQKALEHHVDEIEFDVRVSSDNVVLLHHHAYIQDGNGAKLDIHEHTYAELKRHLPDLITLEEALDYIDTKAVAHIEVKPKEAITPIIRVIEQVLKSGLYTAKDLKLASRDGQLLRDLHRALPEVPKTVIEFWSSVRAVRTARAVETKYLSMLEYWLWPGFIRAITKRGYVLYSFGSVYPARARTLRLLGRSGQSNDPSRIKEWQQAGLAGVITDYPDRFDTKK
jgi:glycerophosphoryl diester phosphodiesterase